MLLAADAVILAEAHGLYDDSVAHRYEEKEERRAKS
jgi:hypothetical protein